jgi:hypothetical protein
LIKVIPGSAPNAVALKPYWGDRVSNVRRRKKRVNRTKIRAVGVIRRWETEALLLPQAEDCFFMAVNNRGDRTKSPSMQNASRIFTEKTFCTDVMLVN